MKIVSEKYRLRHGLQEVVDSRTTDNSIRKWNEIISKRKRERIKGDNSLRIREKNGSGQRGEVMGGEEEVSHITKKSSVS